MVEKARCVKYLGQGCTNRQASLSLLNFSKIIF
jgi:hypothetical protein